MNESSNDQSGAIYHPSPQVVALANVQEFEALYKRSLKDPEGFWAERAEELEWFKK